MKRTELKRGSKPLTRTASLSRGKPVKKVNAKRRTSEFTRCYGSKARVSWIKYEVCCACCGIMPTERYPNDNAHLPSRSGMSRKGDRDQIVSLCPRCHAELDYGRGLSWLEALYLVDLHTEAERTEEAWRARQ